MNSFHRFALRALCLVGALLLLSLSPALASAQGMDYEALPKALQSAVFKNFGVVLKGITDAERSACVKHISQMSDKTAQEVNNRQLNDEVLTYVYHLALDGMMDATPEQLAELMRHLPNLVSVAWTNADQADLSCLQSLPKLGLLILSAADGKGLDYQALGGCKRLHSLTVTDPTLTETARLPQSKSIKDLRLLSCGVTAFADGKQFPSLQALNLSGCPIADLSGVPACKKLQTLTLGNAENECRLSGAPTVQSKSLQTLRLSYTKAEMLGALGKLPKLKDLQMTNCGLNDDHDLTPLTSLKALQTLNLRNNRLSVLSFLNELPKGVRCDIGGNPYTVGELPYESDAVRSAVLASVKSVEDGGKRAARDVTRLELTGLALGDMAFLKSFVNLKELTLSDCSFTDASALAGLCKLQRLTLSGDGAVDAGMAASWPEMRLLELDGVALQGDPQPLAACAKLETLGLRGAGLTDAAFVAALQKLTALDLSENPGIADLAPAGKLKKLTRLCIDGVTVTDFSFLKKLKRLEYLQAAASGMTDATMLKGLRKLHYVSAPYLAQSAEEIKKLLPKGCTFSATTGGE